MRRKGQRLTIWGALRWVWGPWKRSSTTTTPSSPRRWAPNITFRSLTFVDKDQLEPGCSVLLNHKVHAVVGVLSDDTDPMVTVMKLEKAPQETYADIGGLDQQIQEIKESVELPLTHPEYYEEMGIKPPQGSHSLRSSRHRKDVVGQSRGQSDVRHLFARRGIRIDPKVLGRRP